MSHMTSSRGRHYRKTQFKRLVQLVTKEYQKKGQSVSVPKIERNLLAKASREFLQLREETNERALLTSRATR